MTHNFAVGDLVRVVKKVEFEYDWDNAWVNRMDAAVGREFIIEGVYGSVGIEFFTPEDVSEEDFDKVDEACDYRYPPGCLELVRAASPQAVMEVI